MPEKRSPVPMKKIEQSIVLIRAEKVVLDTALAELYEVSTKVLNQAVKRDKQRFPNDFRFQLSKDEKDAVVTNCDRLNRRKSSRNLSYAFTQHGAMMVAVLRFGDLCSLPSRPVQIIMRFLVFLVFNLRVSPKL